MQDNQKGLTVDSQGLPPYVSHRTWQKFLSAVSTTVPLRFDSSYFDSLKLSSGERSMLKGTLVFFGLMTPTGNPTPLLHELAKAQGDARQEAIGKMVQNSYSGLFNKLEIGRATRSQIEEYFKKRASGDIERKCLSFFFAIAADGNVQFSPHVKKPSSSRGRKKKPVVQDNPRPELAKLPPAQSHVVSDDLTWRRLLIDKFPSFNPEWPDNLKEKWFDDFRLLKTMWNP